MQQIPAESSPLQANKTISEEITIILVFEIIQRMIVTQETQCILKE